VREQPHKGNLDYRSAGCNLNQEWGSGRNRRRSWDGKKRGFLQVRQVVEAIDYKVDQTVWCRPVSLRSPLGLTSGVCGSVDGTYESDWAAPVYPRPMDLNHSGVSDALSSVPKDQDVPRGGGLPRLPRQQVKDQTWGV